MPPKRMAAARHAASDPMHTIDIALPKASYSVLAGHGALRTAAPRIAALCPERAFVVTDETIWALHGEALSVLLRAQGIAFSVETLPPGEATKSLDTLSRLYGAFYAAGLQRRDPVIAFGGGVVGDVAGFAAATYMRGLPLLQIPTTLLAQVDASVGGKVAVNLPQGKNLAGCFHQPALVVADTALLSSLPARESLSGMAEVVKYAAIGSSPLLSLLESGQTGGLAEIVSLSCRCKAAFIAEDEQDTGGRRMLNFGHTFGHAIERYHAYATYTHGEAVAMGMGLALRAGMLLGVTPESDGRRLLALMERIGLNTHVPAPLADILPLMSGDKKNEGDTLNLVLLRGIGQPTLYPITLQTLASCLL